jgi:hypothetical protein
MCTVKLLYTVRYIVHSRQIKVDTAHEGISQTALPGRCFTKLSASNLPFTSPATLLWPLCLSAVLSVCQAVCHSSMIALPQFYHSTILSNYLYLPQFHIVCLLAILVWQPCSPASVLFYRTIRMPKTLPAVLQVISLWQLFPEDTPPNNLPASHPACSSACNSSMTALPRNKFFIW